MIHQTKPIKAASVGGLFHSGITKLKVPAGFRAWRPVSQIGFAGFVLFYPVRVTVTHAKRAGSSCIRPVIRGGKNLRIIPDLMEPAFAVAVPQSFRSMGHPLAKHSELVEIARFCWRQSHLAQPLDIASELRRMAREYQQRAAKLNNGKLPDLGDGQDDQRIM